jgi:hypothetical protein
MQNTWNFRSSKKCCESTYLLGCFIHKHFQIMNLILNTMRHTKGGVGCSREGLGSRVFHQTSASVHQLRLWTSQSHIESHENIPSQSEIEYHKKNTLKSRRDASMGSKQVIIRLQQACTQCRRCCC